MPTKRSSITLRGAAFTELKLKRLVREMYDGWSESFEPGFGGGLGIPDLQFLVKFRLLPVELKIRGNVLSPVQKDWHERFAKAGGVSALIEGDKERDGKINLKIRGFDKRRDNWQFIDVPLKQFFEQWVPW